MCVIIDESNKLNKNPSLISLELILSFLLCISSEIRVATNIQDKKFLIFPDFSIIQTNKIPRQPYSQALFTYGQVVFQL